MGKKWVLTVVAAMLLAFCFSVSVIQSYVREVSPPSECSLVSFNDDFGGSELDRGKWDVFEGSPIVGGGWLTLSSANIQSKSVFSGGILRGVIQSSDWKPQGGQFTDSSFGFETWRGECHYGIIFKPSGHLAILRPVPSTDGSCSGDPLYQAYPPIPNWDTIRAGGTVSFTLSWNPNSVTLWVSGNGQEGQVSYAGQAIPNVPLKIRLYAQTNESYRIDYIRLCAINVVFLPIVQ